MDASNTLPAHFFRPDGSLKGPDERAADRATVRQINDQVRREADALRPPKSKAEVVRQQVADLKRKLHGCLPRDREGIKRRIAMYGDLAKDLEEQESQAIQAEKFANCRELVVARDLADSYLRTSPSKHIDQESLIRLRAIAYSDAFDDPQEQARRFHAEEAQVLKAAWAKEDAAAADARHAVLAAEVTAAKAMESVSATQLRAQQAATLAESPNE